MTKDEYDDLNPHARKDYEESEEGSKQVEEWRDLDEGKINFDH